MILARVEEVRPLCSPDDVVAQFAAVFQAYRVTTVMAGHPSMMDRTGVQGRSCPTAA